MDSPFLCGMALAWALAKIAVGAFFLLTYAYRRREAEYLLFGLLCFAVALDSAGIALAYHTSDKGEWLTAARLAHAGAIAAGALNLHFVMRYTRVEGKRLIQIAYALAGLFLILDIGNFWFEPGTVQLLHSEVFGNPVVHAVASPRLLPAAFYLVVVAELIGGFVMLLRAFLGGQREAGWVMVGSSVLVLVATNDILLITGKFPSVYLVPHGFLVYIFAIATTLPARYQSAEKELAAKTVDLAHATQELRNSYVELQVVQDQLTGKEQLAQVGELAAAIAHEVRNPLAIIVNATASLRRPQLADDDRTMLLGIVEEEAGRLNRLVTDLLRFARPVKVNRSPVAMAILLQRAEARLLEGFELELEISDDPDVQTVWADAGLLPLVFENLVSNACQAMRDGGNVKISAKVEERSGRPMVKVTISDSGHGMDEDVMSRATDPFFTTRPSGTGLGLPIVDRIVKAHGGELEIDSSPGEGTDISLFLPVGKPDDDEEELPPHLQKLIDAARRKA
ncbi:MAG: ATP-binding protein [Polyangiaceae bacterium]